MQGVPKRKQCRLGSSFQRNFSRIWTPALRSSSGRPTAARSHERWHCRTERWDPRPRYNALGAQAGQRGDGRLPRVKNVHFRRPMPSLDFTESFLFRNPTNECNCNSFPLGFKWRLNEILPAFRPKLNCDPRAEIGLGQHCPKVFSATFAI